MNARKPPSLRHAVVTAALCLLALGVLAFWPAPRWVTPSRPALHAPIVFDELQNFRNSAADAGTTTPAP